MPNEDLIRAYKNTRKLIDEDIQNKETIINEYIDLVDKINYYETSSKSISNDTNVELGKMFKNPIEIAIYNNFQRYNDKLKTLNSTSNNNERTITDSSKFLASVYDFKNK